jgi:small subunit ribosomal protein S6
MRIYELTIILKPQLPDSEIAEFVDKAKKQVVADGGEVLVEEKQGRRKLYHEINHNRDGFYVFLRFKATTPMVEKYTAALRVNDAVLRFMSIRSEEKEIAPAPKPAAVAAAPAAVKPA